MELLNTTYYKSKSLITIITRITLTILLCLSIIFGMHIVSYASTETSVTLFTFSSYKTIKEEQFEASSYAVLTTNFDYDTLLLKVGTSADSGDSLYYPYIIIKDNTTSIKGTIDVKNSVLYSDNKQGNMSEVSHTLDNKVSTITLSDGSTLRYIYPFNIYVRDKNEFNYDSYNKGYNYDILNFKSDYTYDYSTHTTITQEDLKIIFDKYAKGELPKSEPIFDESTATYSADIPTPKITVNSSYDIGFNNATDDYYIQIKGRWYSVDDIELYKENLMWKYKYSSTVKSQLIKWIADNELIKASMTDINLKKLGSNSFSNLLGMYPIENRSYSGGTNAFGNWLSGYHDALSMLKNLLKEPTSIYNGLEIYVRYVVFDDNGNAVYGKWCHYYDNIAKPSGSSGTTWDDKENIYTDNQSNNGLTDGEMENLEESDNSKNDIDITPSYNDSEFQTPIIGNLDLTNFIDIVTNMIAQSQSFLSLFANVFNFLPTWLLNIFYTSISLACIVGLIKIIRG